MESIFQVNPQLDIPIYQQLVDKIRSAVRMGDLVPGQQLPTVQEMSKELSIARGTIKRAYDELEYQGVLEKIQGRGTFICYQPENSTSRKEQAMGAIDALLDKLENMGFSSTEINIFLTLKQRERTERLSVLKVAALECNPENLSQMSEQLRCFKGIDLYSYLLDGVQEYPYKLDEDMDIVLTTAEHAPYVESILSDRKKLARVALRLSFATLSGIVSLRPEEKAGILCCSGRFGGLVMRSCKQYAPEASVSEPQTFSQKLDVDAYLNDKDVVLVPVGYEKYCTAETAQKLEAFGKRKKLVFCGYKLDDGSALYLEEKLQQLRSEKLL